MQKRNCPNCGAPYNVDLVTCPYCDTSYFDMSSLDLSDGTPFYLKIKTSLNDGRYIYITQLVRPHLELIEHVREDIDSVNDLGVITDRACIANEVRTEISFTSVPGKDGSLIKMVVCDGS